MNERVDTTQELIETRGSTHGDFKTNSRVYRKLCDVVSSEGAKLNLEQSLAIDMIFVKLARIISGNANFKGHWEDVAGYAVLGKDACE